MTRGRAVPDRLLHDSVASLLEAHWLVREVYGQRPANDPPAPDIAGPAARRVIHIARSEITSLLSRIRSLRADPATGPTAGTTRPLDEIEARLHAIARVLHQT